MKKLPYLFWLLLPFFLVQCKYSEKVNSTDTALTEVAYSEQHRPQFHFSPEANWMNDPNGMVYYDGEYHLFYQYYPDSTVWGPMHWGHAVSSDMVAWEHLPIALYPDSLGFIFSGSAVMDWKNTSGFGTEENPPMIAIFTHHNMEGEKSGSIKYQYQSIAYSLDKGRTWTKYQGNPVVPNPGIKDFRDPKVIWHEESKKWVMVFSAYDQVKFYTSSDLKDWTPTGEFGIKGDDRLWECPDLFPLKVEGTDKTKWILITSIQQKGPNGGTATGYFVGDFDGKTFLGDPDGLQWLDYGTDNYAFVTWSDVPKEDGRRLGIGWMSNWQYAQVVPTEKWRSAMTLPRVLTLHSIGTGYMIKSSPVKELSHIEATSKMLDLSKVDSSEKLYESKNSCLKIELSFRNPGEKKFGLRFYNQHNEHLDVLYDKEQLIVDRTRAGKSDFHELFAARHYGEIGEPSDLIELTIFLDYASIEVFANEGSCVMTEIFFPTAPFSSIKLIGTGEVELLESLEVTPLESIWKRI